MVGLGLARALGAPEVALGDTRLAVRVTTVEDGVASLHGEGVLGHGREVESLDAGVSGDCGSNQGEGSGDKGKELHCCRVRESVCERGSMLCER